MIQKAVAFLNKLQIGLACLEKVFYLPPFYVDSDDFLFEQECREFQPVCFRAVQKTINGIL